MVQWYLLRISKAQLLVYYLTDVTGINFSAVTPILQTIFLKDNYEEMSLLAFHWGVS